MSDEQFGQSAALLTISFIFVIPMLPSGTWDRMFHRIGRKKNSVATEEYIQAVDLFESDLAAKVVERLQVAVGTGPIRPNSFDKFLEDWVRLANIERQILGHKTERQFSIFHFGGAIGIQYGWRVPGECVIEEIG